MSVKLQGTFSDQLAALMAWRARPELEAEPLKSNWRTAANDNGTDEATVDFSGEQNLEITPSIAMIHREMGKPSVRNDNGQVIAIGALRFSDGTQTEKAFKNAEGKVVEFDRRVPLGGMLGQRERLKEQSGPSDGSIEVTSSNNFFAQSLKTAPARYVSGARKRRRGKSYTASQSAQLLAQAIANTTQMPPIKKLPPGLPCGTRQVSDCFVGMKVGSTGRGGALAWEDALSGLVEREAWAATVEALSAGDIQTLDEAMGARSYQDLGIKLGQGAEHARRKGGKRALLAANDNLFTAITKAAA